MRCFATLLWNGLTVSRQPPPPANEVPPAHPPAGDIAFPAPRRELFEQGASRRSGTSVRCESAAAAGACGAVATSNSRA